MSIQVINLSKIYGPQKALDNINFTAEKGQVVGFLGPNGAGKTTTMKILTCFISPDGGEAKVCNYDVVKHSLEVRRRIGYLPEHNPLYKDLYVREYLLYMARLNKVENPEKRVKDMVDMTGLGPEQHKLISSLSKGYRQRVGLAQAMMHNPEVLILDEPTSGLDPNQIVDIRELIKNLGKEKTVIFSTHIMQEVQALCDRVIIINQGKIVADDKIEILTSLHKDFSTITVSFKEKVNKSDLATISGVQKVQAINENEWQLTCSAQTDIRPKVFEFAVSHSLTILELKSETVSVEDVFQQLTGKNSAK